MAAIQQTKLTQVEALRQTNERMGEEVDQLKVENVRLQTSVTSLETSVGHLQEMSTTLETIRATEGQSIDELERQLKESESILDQMQDNLRGDIVQTLISMVLAIDHDGDMCLSDSEIDSLIVKIEEMSAGSIDLKEDLLRAKLVENGRSLMAVMDLIKDLLDEDAPPENSIFAFINKKE
jgi:chromosome segregation ATPase